MKSEEIEPQRWERIKWLYHAALDRDANEREAFLAEACAGDESLRGEVESLLHCDDRAEGFIEAPALEIAARAMAADQNEPSLLQDEQRAAPDRTVIDVAGAGVNGRRRLVLTTLLLALALVNIGVHTWAGLRFSRSFGSGLVLKHAGRAESVGRLVDADGPAAALRPDDLIVLLNGHPLDKKQFFRFFAKTSTGTAYSVVVKRDGQLREFTLRTGPVPLAGLMGVLINPLVLPLACLLLGFAVLLLKPDNKQALLLALALGALYLDNGFSLEGLPTWLLAGTVAARMFCALCSLFFIHLFLFFPETSPLARRFPWLEYVIYLPALLLLPEMARRTIDLRGGTMLAADMFSTSAAFKARLYFVFAYCVALILLAIFNYRQAGSLARRKMRIVLGGVIAGTAPITLSILALAIWKELLQGAALTFGQFLWLTTGLSSALLLPPIAIAYAIARHQVIPVSLIIRRSLQYLFAKNALRLLLALPLAGLALTIYANRDRTLSDLLFHNSIGFYASMLAAVALGMAYRHNLRDWLDRRFFREAYRQDEILRELTEEVRKLDSLAEMARRVSQKVDAAIHPERLYLFHREEGRRDLALGYSSADSPGGSGRDLRIPAEFELLRFMEYQGGAQDFPFPARTKLPPREKEWLWNLGASLIVPMRGTDDRLTGLLVLGPKKSEIPYTGSDRQLLETLADQIALVYENARLKERVAQDRRVQHEVLNRIAERQINLLKECPRCGDCYDSAARVCAKDQAELELTLPVERTLEGKYRLERLLGKGGMGAVYEASDLRLRRRVAVKVMTGRLFGDLAALRRFEREARASARLNHPNIIVVHDYGRAGAEGAYLVMELVAGATLREALKASGPQPPAEVAIYFEQILAGLKAAHDAGVIHRDMKPENVLIAKQEDGRAMIKLLDFGIAKLRALDAADSSAPTIPGGLTAPGMVIGTFGYMSPEQLQGEEVDERADIFAVGVMIVESLTGRRPFEGKSHAELLTSILHKTFTLPGDAPAIRRLDAVLQKCLAKERTSRYSTVIELQGALIPALKGCPQLAAGIERGAK